LISQTASGLSPSLTASGGPVTGNSGWSNLKQQAQRTLLDWLWVEYAIENRRTSARPKNDQTGG
jgi:hypothetical protein